MDKDAARQKIQQIVDRFRDTDPAQRAAYNEQQTREYFVLPLFRALGWDTTDPEQVSAEERISGGYADFGFYVGGYPVFYLETKRVGETLATAKHVKQATNYAYLRGVTWAVLSDFENLMVFNAQIETPHPLKDANFLDLHWASYATTAFDELWKLSREAMTQRPRPLDVTAETYGRKARKQSVTESLYDNLVLWRKDLFRAMTGLLTADAQTADNAVQKLFDRLIFLRSIEDREIDDPHLRRIYHQHVPRVKGNPWPQLLKLFQDMDGVYDSNLFEPHDVDAVDINDPGLLVRVLKGLYRNDTGTIEYDFKAITADVLGRVYEQYLAFKATDPQAEIDTRKSKKRHSQGIYYTPEYVVTYIVTQTITRLLESDPDLDPGSLRVLDPACGSGSFLIAAFDALDAAYKKREPDATPDRRQEWRYHILTQCLYGVDLDAQAVEVTRLNLTLRAALSRGKLPRLDNIRLGNALVSDDAVAGRALGFDWHERFKDVMAAGGFHAVIGNPPYVRQETLGPAFKDYAQSHYATYAGTADLYTYFIERGLRLTRPGGRYSVIVANKWLRANYGKALRRWLKAHAALCEIVDFGDLPVFQDATTYPCILTARPLAEGETPPARFEAAQVDSLLFDSLDKHLSARRYPVAHAALDDGGWSLAREDVTALLGKLRAAGTPLGDYVDGAIYYGVKTGYNAAFVVDRATRDALIASDPRSAEVIKPFLAGRDVKRYAPLTPDKWLIFTRRGIDMTQYPAVLAHLEAHKERLTPRPADWTGGDWPGRKAGSYAWYEIQDTVDYYAEFDKPKIVFPDISLSGNFTFDEQKAYLGNTAYIIPVSDLFLLAILNSSATDFFYRNISSTYRGGYLRWISQYVKQLPIPTLAADDPRRAELSALAQKMLSLQQTLADDNFIFHDHRHETRRRIQETDQQIDQLVYALYGLTDAEIALVEASVPRGEDGSE